LPSMSGQLIDFNEALRNSLFVQKKVIEFVRKGGRGESPGAFESRSISVAAAEGMSTSESDNFLIIESAHRVS